ncbi:hypothetical protein F5888DRAFT_1800754 [Russula emetica]|nr:hypothetical protein F5888DRAFT_1800754 [Russula emetica]
MSSGKELGAKPEIRDKEGRLLDDPTLVKAGLEVRQVDMYLDLFSHPTNSTETDQGKEEFHTRPRPPLDEYELYPWAIQGQ